MFNILRNNTQIMGEVQSKAESLPDRPIGGLDGICPKCKNGKLKPIPQGKYVPLKRNKKVELVNRAVYGCSNPDCDYENIAIVFAM